MKTYSSIEELTLTLALYPNQKESILEEAGSCFNLDRQYVWFVIAEDGNCALFNRQCELDDLSKVKILNEPMIRKNIKKINIPDSVEIIRTYTFEYCTSLASIDIPASVKCIEGNAFENCENLASIKIPDSVTYIGNEAFLSCRALKTIIIPDSVKYIGSYAFRHCASLESIILNSAKMMIGHQAFRNCLSLKEVIFKGKTIDEVAEMRYYPWDVVDESIIKCEP